VVAVQVDIELALFIFLPGNRRLLLLVAAVLAALVLATATWVQPEVADQTLFLVALLLLAAVVAVFVQAPALRHLVGLVVEVVAAPLALLEPQVKVMLALTQLQGIKAVAVVGPAQRQPT
jgi:hypothetical protein